MVRKRGRQVISSSTTWIVNRPKQAIAYVYGHADKRDADIANVLTMDEARRIASNIAKLPRLLGKG